ncbi:hypothetical protein M431DRAFT_523060 [Trichoderma harzianum CBS 226.95]|uniref:NACHT domain-containing protein n=1 Tax=Trichoderma harzianum CBS 226.95 TaxID=983964 RepID=A0A2T4A249_TRIHA|nr:hypothetical protein M431DRAFT_523060 [Trichoderma harzianum CBS 226.95]PTB51142.1 hypothetical protein M431DRAFT_523060 [Trichoderma harzianum CBS 226.95]
MNSTTPHSYDITNNTFGNNVRIHQGDIHNHDSYAPSQADPCLIKGDPGKGKTMLLCSIINELEKLNTYRLSYFFCQATETGLRSATAVLRGLIYSLVIQQPSLLSHVQEKYDRAGKQLFKDRNTWTALSKILKSILNDPSLKDVVLLIDALDECTEGLLSLLHLIREISSTSYAKWIMSSRNWPSIEVELQNFKQSIRLCLELNEHSISAAVQNYIHYKVDLLAQKHGYKDIIRETIEKTLEYTEDISSFTELIRLCGSFFTICNNIIYFVHQSAKEYLTTDKYNPDPLIAVQHSCVYWINYLCDGNIVDMFLRRHFLHWLEALSLLHCMLEGVSAIARLTDLLQQTPRSRVSSLVQDARRFIFRHKRGIESTPLQVYVSALIFSPLQSEIRNIFKDKEPP